jgi:enoyl-CoA hydratase
MSTSGEVERAGTSVELARDGEVATITFSTEGGVNVLSSGVIADLRAIVERLEGDDTVRFVVLRGTGRTFVAGADIKEMQLFDEAAGFAFSRQGHDVFDDLESLHQVTIAAINGAALGGGAELTLACDFRIMVVGAKIGQPECRLGLIPGWGGTRRLRKLVGLPQARRMLFTGEPLTAEQAQACGLVDKVVADDAAMQSTLREWITALRAGSPMALRRIKHAIRNDDEMEQFSQCFCDDDFREGITAFLEKRKPNWST